MLPFQVHFPPYTRVITRLNLNLVFMPNTQSSRGNVLPISQPTNELELKSGQVNTLNTQALKFQSIPPPATDGTGTFNTGQSIPLKFRLLDQNGALDRDEQVTFIGQKTTAPFTTNTGSFVYDIANEQYRFVWTTPSGAQGQGVWHLKYVINYQSTDPAKPEILLQPIDTGDHTQSR